MMAKGSARMPAALTAGKSCTGVDQATASVDVEKMTLWPASSLWGLLSGQTNEMPSQAEERRRVRVLHSHHATMYKPPKCIGWGPRLYVPSL